MKIEDIKNLLTEYFDAPEKNENLENLNKIINNLKEKKSGLKEELKKQCEIDETSAQYHDLGKEYKVVNKLLKKAKKHYKSEQEREGDEKK